LQQQHAVTWSMFEDYSAE